MSTAHTGKLKPFTDLTVDLTSAGQVESACALELPNPDGTAVARHIALMRLEQAQVEYAARDSRQQAVTRNEKGQLRVMIVAEDGLPCAPRPVPDQSVQWQ